MPVSLGELKQIDVSHSFFVNFTPIRGSLISVLTSSGQQTCVGAIIESSLFKGYHLVPSAIRHDSEYLVEPGISRLH